MEKIKVNNQVVDMRKHVKQAKIHIINKLTKEVKLLQNRKGNEVQVQKAKRKAERFLEEIAIIKKTKPDDISKLALVKAKNWKEILQQKNLPLQERCTAMLANYEPVQKAVEAFHSANKDLALKLEDLIKQWEDKKKLNLPKNKKIPKNSNKKHMEGDGNVLSNTAEKLERPNKNEKESKSHSNKKLKMTKESKVRKGKDKSVSEKPEENIASSQISSQKLFTENVEADSTISSDKLNDNHDPTDSDDSESDNEMLNSEPNAENTLKIKRSSPNKNAVDDDNINKSNDEDLSDEQNLSDAEEMNSTNGKGSSDEENTMDDEEPTNSDNSEIEKESKEAKHADKVTKLDISEHLKNSSKNKFKKIAMLNLDELQDLDEIPIGTADVSEESDENKTSEDETNDAVEGEEEDSFFLRCSGDSDADDDHSYKQKDFQKSDRSATENADAGGVKPKFFETHKSPRERDHKGSFQRFPGQKKSFVPFKNESRNSKFKSKNFHDRFQNKNRSFGKPYGSKIEHKNYPSKESYHMKKTEKKTGGLYHRQSFDNSVVKNKSPVKKGVTTDKPLHPSWEARRKQKEIINTQFQGKRMVFDD